jgi:phosphatidylserine decarboxylase
MINMKIFLQYILPKKFISWLMGKLASLKHPIAIKNYGIKKYIKYYKVDLSEAIKTDYREYKCFNDFFSRHLHPAARAIDLNPSCIISPADGAISMLGKISVNTLIQAKKHDYLLQDLLGGKVSDAEKFINGEFITIYLSPKDYHRVHVPFEGKLVKSLHVPGQFFSVNPSTVDAVPNLFARNERVINFFETSIGHMAVIFVGAIVVGSIVISAQENTNLKKGDELGCFQLGSTVIVLFQENKISFPQNLNVNSVVKMGEKLAEIK